MRITYKQSSAGEDDGITRFPNPKVKTASECFNAEGYPDRTKLLGALSGEGFTVGSDDPDAVLLFGTDLAIEARKWMENLYPDAGGEPSKTRAIATAERRMRNNRVAYARVYVTARVSEKTIVVRVGYGNPKQTAGKSEEYSKLVAIMLLQVARQLADQWNRDSKVRVVLEDHESCQGLVAEADADFAVRLLRNRWKECGHYKCGMCAAREDGTPPDFRCMCFDKGRCNHT